MNLDFIAAYYHYLYLYPENVFLRYALLAIKNNNELRLKYDIVYNFLLLIPTTFSGFFKNSFIQFGCSLFYIIFLLLYIYKPSTSAKNSLAL